MNYQKLGKSDLQVSEICLGTMNFGEQNTQNEAFEQLDYATENGVNFIDTAEMYSVPGRLETLGSTEKIIGNWLSKRNKRQEVIIATKVVGPGVSYIRNGPNFTRQQINSAINGSLINLQTDNIDLYQLHWPERENNRFGVRLYPFEKNTYWENNLLDVAQSMNLLIKEGKIKHWGISNETAWGAMKYLQVCKENNLIPPVSIQNAYGLLNRQFEYGMSEVCQMEGLGLMAYSPLAFGVLSGKYLNNSLPEKARLTLFPIFKRFLNPRAMEATKKYQELANDNGWSVVEMALAFVQHQPFVHTTIVGATNLTQLQENINSCNIKLSVEVIAQINHLFDLYPDPAL